MFQSDIDYHLRAVDEMKAKGFSTTHSHDMVEMLREKQEFYERYPTKQGRRMARKEGVKAGRWY